MKYAAIFLSFFLLFACQTKSSDIGNDRPQLAGPDLESPEIQVKVEGYNTRVAYLIGWFQDQQYGIDSAIIDATGTMIFSREEPYQPGMLFVLMPDKTFFQMLVGSDQTFNLSTRKGDLINGMQITGSTDNQLLYDNLKYESAYTSKYTELSNKIKELELRGLKAGSEEYDGVVKQRNNLVSDRKAELDKIFRKYPDTFFTKFKQAGQNPELTDVRKPNGVLDTVKQLYLYRTQFWDNVDFSNNWLLYTPVIGNKLKKYMTELTPQHQDSVIAAADFLVEKVLDKKEYFKYFVNWITINFEPTKTSIMDADAIYVHMIKNYFTYDRAYWSDSFEVYNLQNRANEMAQSLIGKKAPDVQAKDPSGTMRSLMDLKAPYIVVFMYSPSCDHCIEEAPKVARFYEQYKDKGVDVFGIGVDTEEAEWKEFVKKNGLDRWTNVFDPTNKAIYKKYFVDITPEIYVLNPERVFIGKNLKADQIPVIIEKDRKKR